MRRWLPILVLLIAAAGLGWLWGSPYLTLDEIRLLAQARDLDALATHVDFASVRTSMKTQLRDRMRAGTHDHGALSTLVASGLADSVVDAAVTPEGMSMIFEVAPLASTTHPNAIRLKAQDMRYVRDSWDRFRLVRKDGKGGELVFRLRGVRWMLSDLRLPPDPIG